jgi:hypothetical protein
MIIIFSFKPFIASYLFKLTNQIFRLYEQYVDTKSSLLTLITHNDNSFMYAYIIVHNKEYYI